MSRNRIRRSVVGGLAAVVALSLALVACSPTKAPPKEEGPATLRLVTWDAADPAALLQSQIDIFVKKTGINVTLETLPGDNYADKLRTQLGGGTAPDVWRIWGGALAEPFVKTGKALDLGSYYKEYGWGDLVLPNAVDAMTYGGVKYGVPASSAALGAWYSKAAFKTAGIDGPPKTYGDLENANEKLVAAGFVPLSIGGVGGSDLMRLFEYLLEHTAGPKLHDKLLKGDASWDNDAVVDAFKLLSKWSTKGWLPAGVLGVAPADADPGFAQGKAGYAITTQASENGYIVGAGLDPADFGTFILPTDQDPLRFSGFVDGYQVSADTKFPKAAAKLLDFLVSADTQRATKNVRTAVIAAIPDAAQYPNSAKWAKLQADNPQYLIQDQAFPRLLADTFFDVQSKVIQGTMSPADAAKAMEAGVKDWVATR